MKICILAGGLSPERDVSLSSASLIGGALRRSGHRTATVDVYLGVTSLPENIDSLFTVGEITPYRIPETAPDLEKLKRESGIGDALIGPNVIEVCREADVVFLALHGAMGENGQLQATLDSYGIRYTGSGYFGSALAMDKDVSKRLAAEAGVPTAEWIYCPVSEVDPTELAQRVGFPCVVKPCSCGSSVGVSMIYSEDALAPALAEAERYEGFVLIERMIRGREFSVGILGDVVLPPIEIIPNEGFYDYKNKYSGATCEVCPAPLTEEETAALSRYTRLVFKTLRLKGYARCDFMRDERDGGFYFLEANTLPGMTPASLLPQEAAAIGISYDELCCMIAETAV